MSIDSLANLQPGSVFYKSILFTLLLSMTAHASKNLTAPDSDKDLCSYYDYDYLNEPQILEELIQKDQDPALFVTANPAIPLSVHLSDLRGFAYETSPVRAEQNGVRLKQKLARVTVAGALLSRRRYYQVIPELFAGATLDSRKINRCLSQREYLKDLVSLSQLSEMKTRVYDEQNSKTLSDIFLSDHIIAAAIIRRLTYLMEEYPRLTEEKIQAINKLRYQGSLHYRVHGEEEIQKSQVNLTKKMNRLLGVLSYFIGRYSVLVDFNNDFSIGDWVNFKYDLSNLGKVLVSGFDQKQGAKLVDEFLLNDNQTEEQLESLLKDFSSGSSGKYIVDFIKWKNTPAIQKRVLQEVRRHVYDINDRLVSLCENENLDNLMVSDKDSIKLYHSPLLVAKVFAESAEATIFIDRLKKGSTGELSQEEQVTLLESKSPKASIIRDQSGYCQLIRKDPPKPIEFFTWKTGVGLGMGVGALVLFFLTGGLGPIVLSLLVGGAGFTGIDLKQRHGQISNKLEGQRILSLGGWADLQEMAYYESALVDVWIDGALESGFAIAGVNGVRKAAKASIELRKDLELKPVASPPTGSTSATGSAASHSGTHEAANVGTTKVGSELESGVDDLSHAETSYTHGRERPVKGYVDQIRYAYNQGRMNQYRLQEMNSENYINGLWARYDELAEEALTAGQKKAINKIEDTRDDWMRWNGNPISARHLFYRSSSSNKDAYTTVFTFVKTPKSDDGVKAMGILREKLQKYERFRGNGKAIDDPKKIDDMIRTRDVGYARVGEINVMIREGMEAGIQSGELRKFIRQHTTYWRGGVPRFDEEVRQMVRQKGYIEVPVTRINRVTGEYYPYTERFGSTTILSTQARIRENIYRSTFATRKVQGDRSISSLDLSRI